MDMNSLLSVALQMTEGVQKGQLRYIKKQDICAQNQLIDKLFGLAA
ncbi:hypothetical protein PsalMR5_04750 (plasmid) [Piscirickettsia salmonis]|nr:hypothetical protein PsalSR1_04779 [Piscirickettsia salmonis]QGP61975.1 hypothetical protein PsalBI1_04617 [Piscirickettsia salmonis]QGP61986.1 hypothetical protein PsalBI1_04628 [Piscirickettsia salmonis]QGP66825.1 hypothetical protein PsalMR5_04750 [Piscirickettsia salmonis]